MTMELEECIKDGFDDSLRDYIQSEEFIQRQEKVDDMITALRINLNADQQLQLSKIIDSITSEDGRMALTAYVHGVVEGIALRNKVIK